MAADDARQLAALQEKLHDDARMQQLRESPCDEDRECGAMMWVNITHRNRAPSGTPFEERRTASETIHTVMVRLWFFHYHRTRIDALPRAHCRTHLTQMPTGEHRVHIWDTLPKLGQSLLLSVDQEYAMDSCIRAMFDA